MTIAFAGVLLFSAAIVYWLSEVKASKRGSVVIAVVAGVAAAGFAISPVLSLTRQAREFHQAGQRTLGPPGSPLLPPEMVAAAVHDLRDDDTWSIVTPPIKLPETSPLATGLLAAARAIYGRSPYSSADKGRVTSELSQISRRPCGDIEYVGWLAYLLLPHSLSCVNADVVLYWHVRPPAGSTVVSSGAGWSVTRT